MNSARLLSSQLIPKFIPSRVRVVSSSPRFLSSGRRRPPPPNHTKPGGSNYTDFNGMFSSQKNIPTPEIGEQRSPLNYSGFDSLEASVVSTAVRNGSSGDPLNFIRRITKSALSGDIYTLPSSGSGVDVIGISPASIHIYDESNNQGQPIIKNETEQEQVESLLSQIGENGIALSPSHGDSSYSNPRMTFYVSVVPGGRGVSYGSPVSGTSEFR